MIIVIAIIGIGILSWMILLAVGSASSGIIALGYFALLLLVAVSMACYQQWLEQKKSRDD